MDADKLSEIILEKLHELMQSQAELKASVDAHIEKVNEVKAMALKQEDIIKHHSVLFKAVFWASTTLSGLFITWIIKLKS